jgi:hypothetical protein
LFTLKPYNSFCPFQLFAINIYDYDDLFSESCKKNIEKLSEEDLTISKEVVVLNDNNFCRARINSKIENDYQVDKVVKHLYFPMLIFKLFQLFLIDFGVFLVKSCDEIYKLQKEYHKKPKCIYQGTLQNYSEEEFKNLKSACNSGFCVGKILGIRNENTVDIKLEAFK